MIGNLVVLVLLLGGLIAAPIVLRRVRGVTPDGIRVLGRTALHKQAVVAVVAVGERRLLVGAGDQGVQLLADLGVNAADASTAGLELDGATTTTTVDRMDAADTTSTSPTSCSPAELAPLQLDGVLAGPGTGLVDRLRAMTVRTPTQGRPIDVLLRR